VISPLLVLGLVAILALFALVATLNLLLAVRSGGERPYMPTTPQAPVPELAATWTLEPGKLRPDLADPEILTPVDGSFDDNHVVAVGDVWAILTSDHNDRNVAVHGIDQRTGEPRWRKELPDGICAANPLGKALLCARSAANDPATGLGIRWRISLLDPATGRERRGVDFDGWLTLMHVHGDRLMLVEQRQPAPHAVVTVLDAALERRSRLDLSGQPEHAGLFSDNRIYNRTLPIPDGPALDRPRIRTVADNLTALWAGQTTAFFDLKQGTLVAMPRCSRLVDDGERLWCNAGPLAIAHDYALKPLYSTVLNTRLAFPDRDPRAGDVTDPVFLEIDGKAVRVDLTTGETIGPLVNTSNGSAFGMTTPPQVSFVDGRTLIWDTELLFAVNARTGELFWQREKQSTLESILGWHGDLLFAGRQLQVVDPATGTVGREYRQPHGQATAAVGDVLIGIGSDELARLVDP